MDEVEHDDERQHDEDEARREACDGLRARRALRALDYHLARFGKAEVVHALRAGGVEDDVQAVLVAADDKAVYKLLDDLARGQRHYRQIVAAQPQHRHAHDKPGHGGEYRAHDERQHQPHRSGGNSALQAHRGYNAGKSADAHKARVSKAQLAQNADRQVQRHGHHDVAAYRHQLPRQRTGQHTVVFKDCQHNKGQCDAQICRKIDLCGFFQLFHVRHLRPSPARICPEAPPGAPAASR